MNTLLPTTLNVCGTEYEINADFRTVLHIISAFRDDDLTPEEKAMVCVQCLYRDANSIPMEHLEEAIRQAYWFCDGGDIPKSKAEPVKIMDWKQDAHMIFPAVNKVSGFEVRSCAFLHWWSLIGMFCEITDGLFATVLHIRQKKAHGKPLDQWEQEFCARNYALVNLISDEEQAEINETMAFLETIT